MGPIVLKIGLGGFKRVFPFKITPRKSAISCELPNWRGIAPQKGVIPKAEEAERRKNKEFALPTKKWLYNFDDLVYYSTITLIQIMNRE